MPLQNNQGHRRDLDLAETPNDRVALSNLGGTGIGDDLSRLVNNLRNTSKVSFHTLKEGYFDFGDDINVGISSLRCVQSTQTSSTGALVGVSKITIHSDRSYLLRIGDQIKIENVSGGGAVTDAQGNLTGGITTDGVDVFKGDFAITGINRDENQFECIKTGISVSIRDQEVTGSNLIIRGKDVFAYTNDDKITFDKDVRVYVTQGTSVPPTIITDVTFTKGTEYYVCDSNGLDRFNLSTRPSYDTLGISTVVIKHGGSDSGYTGLTTSISPSEEFSLTRPEAVEHGNLINFIAPDIQDDSFSYGSGTITEQMDAIQSNNESSQYFIDKKYKGTSNTTSTDEIKTEGSLTLNDPKQDMTSSNIVTSYATGAGMFIEGTRAFSTDNNPWTDTGTDKLETDSDEVTIGELYFGDHVNGPVITGAGFNGTHASDTLTGVRSITAGTVVPTDFSHKIPVKIENADGNVETYYLLLTRNTDNTSTLP